MLFLLGCKSGLLSKFACQESISSMFYTHVFVRNFDIKITMLCFGFVAREKLSNSLSYKKWARKMLMKYTPVYKVINLQKQ